MCGVYSSCTFVRVSTESFFDKNVLLISEPCREYLYVKKGTRTGEIDENAMKSAMNEVLDKTLFIRKSAQKYGVKPTTLESRLAKVHKTPAEKEGSQRVFLVLSSRRIKCSLSKKTLLNKYMTDCSKMHYGLTIVQVRKLAYEFANQLHYPPSWNLNKMAGK